MFAQQFSMSIGNYEGTDEWLYLHSEIQIFFYFSLPSTSRELIDDAKKYCEIKIICVVKFIPII